MSWQPIENLKTFDPNRYDFEWSEDFSRFRAVPLLLEEDEDEPRLPRVAPPPVSSEAPIFGDDDDFPY